MQITGFCINLSISVSVSIFVCVSMLGRLNTISYTVGQSDNEITIIRS